MTMEQNSLQCPTCNYLYRLEDSTKLIEFYKFLNSHIDNVSKAIYLFGLLVFDCFIRSLFKFLDSDKTMFNFLSDNYSIFIIPQILMVFTAIISVNNYSNIIININFNIFLGIILYFCRICSDFYKEERFLSKTMFYVAYLFILIYIYFFVENKGNINPYNVSEDNYIYRNSGYIVGFNGKIQKWIDYIKVSILFLNRIQTGSIRNVKAKNK